MNGVALLIRPAPVMQTAPNAVARITVDGVLLMDAQMRIEPATQRATLVLRIGQPGEDSPFLATAIGGDDAESAAEFAGQASRMRAGCRVTVRGEGLSVKFERGQRYYRIALVRSMELTAA